MDINGARHHGSTASMARVARALNDAAIPCPSAADPERNPHRSGKARTLHTVRAILGKTVGSKEITELNTGRASTAAGGRAWATFQPV